MTGQTAQDLDRLSEIREQLAAAAAELSGDEISSERAEQLVARCAELASAASTELDRLAGAERDELPGQEELL